MNKYLLILLLAALLFPVAVSVAVEQKPVVFVSVLPQKAFVEMVAGDFVDVEVMVQPGANPHTYEPKPSQMRRLSEATAYVSIGVPFEGVWLDKLQATNNRMQLIKSDHGIEKRAMAEHAHGEHEEETHGHASHGHDAHGHKPGSSDPHDEEGGEDPHIWLAPKLVASQLQSIRDGLSELIPAQAEHFRQATEKALARIALLDEDLKTLLGPVHGQRFLVFHPSWGYFADAYGLEEVAIEVEGKEPKPAQLAEIVREAREDGIKVIFVQPQFSRKSAKLIANEIGGRVVEADPLAGDWEANLRRVAAMFFEAAR